MKNNHFSIYPNNITSPRLCSFASLTMHDIIGYFLLAFLFLKFHENDQLQKTIVTRVTDYENIMYSLDIQCLTIAEYKHRNNHMQGIIGILRIYFNGGDGLYIIDNTFLHVKQFNDTTVCTHGEYLHQQNNIRYSLQNDIILQLNETSVDIYDVLHYLDKQFNGNIREFIDEFEKTFL